MFCCNVCGRWFKSHAGISNHDRTHTGAEIVEAIAFPAPREPLPIHPAPFSEDYAFLLANVRDAVGEDE